MVIVHAKRTALALVAGLAALSCVSGAALAGFDEAHMYSFMSGSDSAPVPPTTEARGHNSNDNARAYYQGPMRMHRSRMHHHYMQR